MSYCPSCKYEYKRDTGVCPDCEETLVESLPDVSVVAEPAPPDDWVQLARLQSSEHAAMILEGLRSKGIPAVILSGAGHFGQTGQMGMSAFRAVGGEYSLMVPAANVIEADTEAHGILGEEWERSRSVDIES